ncbi:unnamed protein product [Dicrocoelium dendriticum]|nr:unnamed protein product [Dicrocoelium dendriticum]
MTFMTLSQRIELERGKKVPNEIRELNLDHSKSTSIDGLTEEYTSLETLSLVSVGLECLAGLPKLPSLKTLTLSNNAIKGGLDAILNCPNLEQLNLSGNKIESVDALLPLAKLSSLRSLDLFNCDVAGSENYRKAVFAALPNLKYLDGYDESMESEPESEDHGGLPNGDATEENGTGEGGADGEDSGDDYEEDEEEDEEEEYGIEALQRSEELEDDDDEEDYAPGEDEEAELDEYDDLDEEEEDDIEEDTGANLSGAGVTGPRRPASKRRREDEVDNASDGAPVTKHHVGEIENSGDAEEPAD